MEEFFEEALCGNVDLYVCGHDHTTQWLEPMCGTEFIVSGAGAKTTDLGNWGVPTFYENDTEPGFVWIEIADNVMTANFYNSKATLLYSSSVTK